MTTVYITIDTEYSSGLANGPGAVDRAENFARSVACITPDGPAGITHKLDLLNRFGQKGVFFVDPMPALQWGVAAIEDIVAPVLDAGHDVQLHCHTEWLGLAGAANPLGEKTGRNIKDFAFEDQCELLTWAKDTLIAAGAPAPVAFRAGNYGANDDTLRALREIGLRYDTSHCPALVGGECDISLGANDQHPMLYEGIIEVPVGCIATVGGGLRHAQITALSLRELTAAVQHARDTHANSFTMVSHSFELINRRKLAVNRIVRHRFEGLCRDLQNMQGAQTGTYRDNPPLPAARPAGSNPLPADPVRSGMRVAEQVLSNTLYGAL
ncbi:polysaccharide deacetylase family protein [Parerythrobacter jejuensis]|uniref:Polysaccharide deacetylase family protein n=1 Tax=Parerythrobacter jejuensis TaxID=795812 RepID=A0A845B031_9SPHN|nr:polysaccharide deacetylase family protein [Parerythrobacter jejuensis]MXP31356.1 polysaccharide deacetylase family protein [Parerythrobacter jejuensis]MXP34116.1 polysaccharide deacetylase family protein [Parerythrobacter jejuensis]